jgi:ABC-type lipoprotein export system ATPase subunit
MSCIANYIGLFRHLYGGAGKFYFMIIFSVFCTITFGVTMKLLKNLKQNLIVKISQKQVNFLSQYDNLKEFETLYQNIDLGILVAKNDNIDYTNDLFRNFLEKTLNFDENNILDLRVFKFFKNTNTGNE